ncbi:LytR C-terminal domain-containing protein [Nocardia wallacei]|uniref:LytR C-terminal domain-containing protein n=1 Tax=Nocardia wallacei TaxID=480035 RepID=UPI00245618FD|nr:LytR C-terminal domain-containing protein [Nocardia wallacei]
MSNPNPPSGGPPLRALAMVLIALAIVFAGLGAMSLSSSESTASDTETQGQATQGRPTSTTSSKPATTSAADTTTTTTSSTTTTTAPSTTPAAAKSVPVHVLNNSTVAGLAARTAGQLSADGWTIAETGNYPGGVIPKTTVYYGNSPGERAAAQEVAEELGVSAEPRFAGIASNPPGVIVIVTGN